MSFGFVTEKDEWRTENGVDVRELVKVKLYDVSPVTYPAYTETDVGIREYEKYKAELRSKNDAADDAVKAAKDKQKLSNLQRKFRNI